MAFISARAVVVAILAVMAFAAPDAAAERRVALVIGNAAYQQTAALQNPKHDAQDMSGALQRLGFEVVEGIDLDKRSMERTIRQFGVKLAGADVALFFYAGHGIQVAGQNYLLPTDARLSTEGDVDFESISLSLVLKQMEREAKTSLVLLDACRDNPLARNLARTMGTRSPLVAQGLAEVKTGVGTLIGFSTQPGNVALDGTGRNSPYATALLRQIEARDVDIGTMLINVRSEVVATTNGRQVPWEHTSLMGRVVFSATPPAPAAGQTVPAPPPAAYDKEMEIAFWNSVKDSRTPELLQTYLNRFPNGTFAELARVLIEQAQPKREGAARADEKPATAVVGAAGPMVSPPPAPAEDPAALVRAIQSELSRIGCEPGREDGKWGPNVTEAMTRFNQATASHHPADRPQRETLAALVASSGRVCPLQCARGEEIVDERCVARAPPEKSALERRRSEEADNAPERRPAKSTSQSPRQESTESAACAQWRRCVTLAGRFNEGRCGLAPRNC